MNLFGLQKYIKGSVSSNLILTRYTHPKNLLINNITPPLPPIVTTTPLPPSVTTTTTTPIPIPNDYTTSLFFQGNEQIKGSGIGVRYNGDIISILYNNISRRNVYVKINNSPHIDMDAETGNIIFVPNNLTPNHKTYISSEKPVSGPNVSRCSELTNTNNLIELTTETAYCGCGVSLNNNVYFCDQPLDRSQRSHLKDSNNNIVAYFPSQVNGIPYDAVVDLNESRVIATMQDSSTGNAGIGWSRQGSQVEKYIANVSARALTIRDNVVLVGVDNSSNNSLIKKIVGTSLVDYEFLNSLPVRSIDSMCVDSYNNLWISTSTPDNLYVLDYNNNLKLVQSISDGSDGGSLFRTRVATNGNKTVWLRNSINENNSCQIRTVNYIITTTTTTTTTPEPVIDCNQFPAYCQENPIESFVRSIMITSLFVNNNTSHVDNIINQVAGSSNWNSICGLIDLQSGRPFIFPGRNRRTLDPRTRRNIEAVINRGLMPILIIRNDWAARRAIGNIPSIGNVNINSIGGNDAFYNNEYYTDHLYFFNDIADLLPHVHIQLNIEPSSVLSAQMSKDLATLLRFYFFKNLIIINPYSNAIQAHENLRPDLNDFGVTWARSRNSGITTPDTIFNSDGNTSITTSNASSFINQVKSTNKPYIIWSSDLSCYNCSSQSSIPSQYL